MSRRKLIKLEPGKILWSEEAEGSWDLRNLVKKREKEKCGPWKYSEAGK